MVAREQKTREQHVLRPSGHYQLATFQALLNVPDHQDHTPYAEIASISRQKIAGCKELGQEDKTVIPLYSSSAQSRAVATDPPSAWLVSYATRTPACLRLFQLIKKMI